MSKPVSGSNGAGQTSLVQGSQATSPQGPARGPRGPRSGVAEALEDLLGQNGQGRNLPVKQGPRTLGDRIAQGIKELLGLREQVRIPVRQFRFQGVSSPSWSTRASEALSVSPQTAAGVGLCALGVIAVFTVSRAGGALAFAEGAALLVADVEGTEPVTYY